MGYGIGTWRNAVFSTYLYYIFYALNYIQIQRTQMGASITVN